MAIRNVNNFFQGGYERKFEVNPYNPFLPKIYSLIDRIKNELGNEVANVLDLKVEPKNYEEMLNQADKMMVQAIANHQTFSVPFSISVKIDTSKMPVEILAQIIKTNSRKAQEYGNAFNKKANAVIIMYDTREEYRKKIELKAQSELDFRKFRCQAKGCNRPNAHRTTIFAVIDKHSNEIKYYGSTCVKRVDGERIIETLDEYIKKINLIANNVEKMKAKAKDGVDIQELLERCLKDYVNPNSKNYYSKIINLDTHLLNNAEIKKQYLLPLLKDNQQNVQYWKALGFTLNSEENNINLKIMDMMKKTLCSTFDRYIKKLKENSLDFIEWLNRSRGIGTNRSNAKGLLRNLNNDDLARGLTVTQMKKIIFDSLNLYVIDSALKDFPLDYSDFINRLQTTEYEKSYWIDKETYEKADEYLKLELEKNTLKKKYNEKVISLIQSFKDNKVSAFLKLYPDTKVYFWKKFNSFNVKVNDFGKVEKLDIKAEKFEVEDGEPTEWQATENNLDVLVSTKVQKNINELEDENEDLEETIQELSSQSVNEFVLNSYLKSSGLSISDVIIKIDKTRIKSLQDNIDKLELDDLIQEDTLKIAVKPKKEFVDDLIKKQEERKNALVQISDEEFNEFLKKTTKVYLKKIFEKALINQDITYNKTKGTSIYGSWYRLDFMYQQTRLGIMFVNNLNEAESKKNKIIKSLVNKFGNNYKDFIKKIDIQKTLDNKNLSLEELLTKGQNEPEIIHSLQYCKDILGKVTFRR